MRRQIITKGDSDMATRVRPEISANNK